jgi:uncharacterized pyridoxamine 5'-phosphate oxidase family protein
MSSDKIIEEAFSHLEIQNVSFLGTSSNSQPFVRPMMLIYLEDRMFYATGVKERKVQYIEENPLVEVCILLGSGDNGGSLHMRGKVVFVKDLGIKMLVSESVPFISRFWGGYDSSTYELLEILPSFIEYMKPGTMEIDRVKV